MAVAAHIKQGSPEWLAARRATIGSSDIPVIVGESTYKSVRTLAAEKLGLIPEDIDPATRELMDIGTLLQPALLRIYERITGRKTRQSSAWLRHPTIDWATASLDGTSGKRAIEAKWSNAVKWRTGERVPGDVEAQVQWQLMVTGWDVADVVALDHGLPRVETIERNDQMIENCLFLATDFHGYLERGELPPPDGSESTRRTWSRMYPEDNGLWLAPTDDLRAMVRELRDSRATKKEAGEREDMVANALRTVLDAAAGIEGLLSARKNNDSTRVNWPAVAGAYRDLLEEGGARTDYLDSIERDNSETSQGNRPLRLLKGALHDD